MAAMFVLMSSRSSNTLISLVERIDHGRGRALRQEHAEPGRDVELGQFRRALAHGRNVRRRRAALRRGHGQRVELAVPHLRQRRKQIVEQDLDVAGSAACSAGPAPRNGTCIIFSPVSCRNQATVRCGLCPTPEEP